MDSYEFGPITPSANHHIFFELPLKEGSPPKPFPKEPEENPWDQVCVKMPHSRSHIEPSSKKTIWEIFSEAFKNPPSNFQEFRKAILSYSQIPEEENSFSGLETFLNSDISSSERKHLFKEILPKIIILALKLPEEITKPVPLLLRGTPLSLSLSQKQIGILLANAFLCTFPPRKTFKDSCGFGDFPDINFNRLFMRHENHTKQKFKCIFNYFERITSEEPDGVVTFTRSMPEKFIFEECDRPLPRLELKLDGGIEEAEDHLQVDFADKYIGGMIFTKGCVQEEIRFLICPELIVTRLFTEVLDDDEAMIITGVEKFNEVSGYGSSFRFVSTLRDQTPRDCFRRRKSQLTAIDAVNFRRRNKEQFKPDYITRDLRKAFAGFFPEEGTKPPFAPVATGNWGCGVFQGTPHLKSLIQLVAAGASGRDVSYFAFGNKNLVKDLERLYKLLKENNVTVGNLSKLLISYHDVGGKLSGHNLHKYIQQNVC